MKADPLVTALIIEKQQLLRRQQTANILSNFLKDKQQADEGELILQTDDMMFDRAKLLRQRRANYNTNSLAKVLVSNEGGYSNGLRGLR